MSNKRGFGPGNVGEPVEKANNFKDTLKRFMSYLKPHKFKLSAVVLMAILSTVFSIISPKIMGFATTKLFEGIVQKMKHVPFAKVDFDYIFKIVMILIVLYAASALFNYFQQTIMADVTQGIVYKMRKDIDDKLSRLPLKFFDSKTHGEILSRITNDVDNISSTLQQSLTQIISSVLTIIGILVMMLTISPIMTLICFAAFPFYILITKGIASHSQKYFSDQQRYLGDLNGHVEEMYTGHNIIKAFGREKESIEKFDDVNEKLYKSGWKAQFLSGVIMPLMNFINNVSYVLICVVGGIFVTNGRISIGDIQAFIQYSRQFTQPISQTANIANILQSTMASAERVFELLDEKEQIPDKEGAQIIEKAKGDVEFKDVNFGYKENEMIIKNMNIHAKKGQTIAIVGPTGAGKTTIVNLLMRFYEINSGKIMIDGIDTREITRNNLRKIFGMVLQDTWLFNGTIRDNIAYSRNEVSDSEIVAAAKTAQADYFIRTLPDGYNTILNEEASNISQGQKQLLTIARAILINPSILILDEATSSVDTRTEEHIEKAMKNLMKGRTSFVIAHRLSTIKHADLILVMNNGSIIENGNHNELLKKHGFYADLYNSQFTGKKLNEKLV